MGEIVKLRSPEERPHVVMRRYAAGDDRALRRLYPELRNRLRGFLRRYASGDVDDLVQDTLLRAHRARDRFEPRGCDPDHAVFAWYVKIARSVAIDAARRRASRSRTAGRYRRLSIEVEHVAPGPEVEASAAEARAEARARVGSALDQLGPEQRRLVLLTKVDGVRPAEVARSLGLSPGAARARVHRAYRALRQGLTTTSAA